MLKNWWKITVLILFISFSSPLEASEVDSFTLRHVPLKDSLAILNDKANEFMNKAVAEANERSGCSKKRLYRKLKKYFKKRRGENFTDFVRKSPLLKRHKVTFSESIYRDFKFHEAFLLATFGTSQDATMAKVLRVNGFYIGDDKFGHFTTFGYRDFKRLYKKNWPLKKVLRRRAWMEGGIMGGWTDGIKSYADLVADFNGMRFWNHILNESEDVLGPEYNEGPYIQCVEDRWVQVKKLDWRSYLDPAWDEAINCSEFGRSKMVKKVKKTLDILEEKTGKSYTCPVASKKLQQAKDKYGPLAPYLINEKWKPPLGESSS